MAIEATVTTLHGESRKLYIRLNNVESSNHGVTTQAKFRGFLSRDAFVGGFHFVWEQDLEFLADVTLPLWSQAYAALKGTGEFADAADVSEG